MHRIALSFWLALSFGCKGSADRGDWPSSDEIEQICGDYGETLCTALEGCCDAGWSDDVRDRCRSRYSGMCGLSLVASQLDDVSFERAAVDPCLTATETTIASCPVDPLESPPQCAAMIVGRVGDGEACQDPSECAPGLVCDRSGGDPATCTPELDEDVACTPGLCRAGLLCIDGACRTPDAEGAPCEVIDEDEEDSCAEGLFCGPAVTCVTQNAGGEACEHDRDCLSWLCTGGTCDRGDTEIGDYCAPFFAE